MLYSASKEVIKMPSRNLTVCPNGDKYTTQKAMCEAYQISARSYQKRIGLGWTQRQALGLDVPPKGSWARVPCCCPNGIEYASMSAMCRAHSMSSAKYVGRLALGWTERQALGLDVPPQKVNANSGSPIISHCPKGNEYPSLTAMCEAYGVKRSSYNNRIKIGWTQRQALGLDTPPDDAITPIPSCCPKGEKYSSIKAMCDAYRINSRTYRDRLESKWTQRQALGLDAPPEYTNSPKSSCCPKGGRYSSVKAMCDAYKINIKSYRSRLNLGWTQRQALGVDEPPNGVMKAMGKPSVCPNGEEFPTIKAMCDAYGVTFWTYKNRLKSGLTQRQALNLDTLPDKGRVRIPCCCPKGKEFSSIRAMCKTYGISRSSYRYRLRTGWTQRQALGIDPAPPSIYSSSWPDYRGVSAKNIANAHSKLLNTLYRQKKSWINYVENTLLWTNESFLGFTEDGLVVLKQDAKITTLEFSKYIDTLSV